MKKVKSFTINNWGVEYVTHGYLKAVNDLVITFVKKYILVEKTGFERNRVFHFDEYVRMF